VEIRSRPHPAGAAGLGRGGYLVSEREVAAAKSVFDAVARRVEFRRGLGGGAARAARGAGGVGLGRLLGALGFRFDRLRGGHLVYRHAARGLRIVLHVPGGEARPFQVRQLLRLARGLDASSGGSG
jgi:predicted RNA binding protein YcfA (HicA-like mRNA interferase family)